MVETSERFSLMGLLQQNLKIIRSEVHCIKGVLKNFAKFTGKHPCWSFLMLDYKDSSAWILRNI